ncbi:hypothetical protein PTKIN_Ptkin15bG0034100 [Pterospermum kingtungense]
MDGEDDATNPMVEEIYANGTAGSGEVPSSSTSSTTRKNRPIISGEPLDIEAYAGLYTGRTKIHAAHIHRRPLRQSRDATGDGIKHDYRTRIR